MANRNVHNDRDTPNPSGMAAAVTPSDATDLGDVRALYVGATGNLSLMMADGDTILFSNVPVGILPVRCQKVMATNTTATLIVALY